MRIPMKSCIPAITICIFSMLGCGGENNPAPKDKTSGDKPASNDKPVGGESKDVSKKPAGRTFKFNSVLEYAGEFKADKEAANKKYDGATIEITGKVDRVDRNYLGNDKWEPLIVLESDLKEGESPLNVLIVACVTTDATPWLKVGHSGVVTIRGVADTKTISTCPFIRECEIESFEGEKYRLVTAADLVKEIAPDKKAWFDKNKKKHLIVTGVFESLVKGTNGRNDRVTFQSAGDAKLDFIYGGLEEDQFRNLKPGDEIAVLLEAPEYEPDEPFMSKSRLR